jgi:peptidoglycan hydrolase CwlO-like protein
MSKAISRLGSLKASPHRAWLPVLAIVVVSVCAFSTSIASAATPAKYKSSVKLTGTKTGKPTLKVTVSDGVKGGRKITKVAITLPSGFKFSKHTKGHVKVAGKRFSGSASGRTLTIKPRNASAALKIDVNHAAITESKKARAARVGKVKLKVTEQTTPGTKTKSQLNALQSALGQIESELGSGQKTLTTNVNSLYNKVSADCPSIAGQLKTLIDSNSGSEQLQAALLQSYDSFLGSSIPSLIKGYGSIESLLAPLGYTSSQPFTDISQLAGVGSNGFALNSKEFCSGLKQILTTSSDATLTSIESALEKQINSYAGDLTDIQKGFTKLETTLKSEASAVQSVLSPSQLTTLEGLLSSITGQLKDVGGSGTTSSNPVASALSTLLNDLSGGTGSLSSTTNPLSSLQSVLGSILSGLGGILGGL